MESLEVKITKISKLNYRIEAKKEGICLGRVINGVVNYLEFRNEFTAKSYIEKDTRLILVNN